MYVPHRYLLHHNTFWLSPNRTLFWEEEKILMLSDAHFGKITHFRKAGIAMPTTVFKKDVQKLTQDIQHFSPTKIVIVGDLFHSIANCENDLFEKWRNDFLYLPFILVQGNHDILKKDWYEKVHIDVIKDTLVVKDFAFQHDLSTASTTALYTFSGHIHPGVAFRGRGKQSLTFPCFYFAKQYAILPAFGHFTGYVIIEPTKEEQAFAIVENEIIAVQ